MDTVLKKETDAITLLSTIKQTEPSEKQQKEEKTVITKELPKSIFGKYEVKKNFFIPGTKEDLKQEGLPEEVKKHFEASSDAFGRFAKERDEEKGKKIDEKTEEKLWNNALFLGEFPGGRNPVEIEEHLFTVPQKKEQPSNDIFPNRVSADPPQKTLNQIVNTAPTISITSLPEKTHVIPVPEKKKGEPTLFIPKKPEQAPTNDVFVNQVVNETPKKNPPPQEAKNINPSILLSIPKKEKPKEDSNLTEPQKNPSPEPVIIKPEPILLPRYSAQKNKVLGLEDVINYKQISEQKSEMGDQLKKRLIETLLTDVFKKAPDKTRETMEKMPAKSIFLLNDTVDDVNTVWKNKLRECLVKLKWQSKTVSEKTEDTDPKEEETVLGYIYRIYPVTVRAEINENKTNQ